MEISQVYNLYILYKWIFYNNKYVLIKTISNNVLIY